MCGSLFERWSLASWSQSLRFPLASWRNRAVGRFVIPKSSSSKALICALQQLHDLGAEFLESLQRRAHPQLRWQKVALCLGVRDEVGKALFPSSVGEIKSGIDNSWPLMGRPCSPRARGFSQAAAEIQLSPDGPES